MNALVNLKKDIWVCMFCGKNYKSTVEHDRLDSWDEIPFCRCTHSWEYKCIWGKKEAKDFRTKYARFIIKSGQIIDKRKFEKYTSSDTTPLSESISSNIKELMISIQDEKSLSSKVSKLEKLVFILAEKLENS